MKCRALQRHLAFDRVRFSLRARDQRTCLFVSDEVFVAGIPTELATCTNGNVVEVANRVRAHSRLDRRNGLPAHSDAVEEVLHVVERSAGAGDKAAAICQRTVPVDSPGVQDPGFAVGADRPPPSGFSKNRRYNFKLTGS